MGTLSLACIAPPHYQGGLSILAEHGSAVVHHTAASREPPARQTPPLEVEDVIHQALLRLTGAHRLDDPTDAKPQGQHPPVRPGRCAAVL
jgi:hypothetical protein